MIYTSGAEGTCHKQQSRTKAHRQMVRRIVVGVDTRLQLTLGKREGRAQRLVDLQAVAVSARVHQRSHSTHALAMILGS